MVKVALFTHAAKSLVETKKQFSVTQAKTPLKKFGRVRRILGFVTLIEAVTILIIVMIVIF